jgi:dienelactone hydrolase
MTLRTNAQAFGLALAFIACNAAAQVARVEVHAFSTVTLTGADFLKGKKDGKPETIAGELRIPRRGTDRLPAVILMHGVGGIAENVNEWSDQLNSMGVATLILDSFTGRGIATVAEGARLPTIVRIVDAYRALARLAVHPRIDPSRVAIMGFSHGGTAALYTSLRRFADIHGPSDGTRFAAHLAVYPPCLTTYRGDDELTGRPVRIFHGSADDWIPLAPCKEYAERLRKGGLDVALRSYADAHHAYDMRAFKEPLKLPDATSFRDCRLTESEPGVLISRTSGQVFTPQDACLQRGTTVAYNAAAHVTMQEDVRSFVSLILKP